MKNKIFDYLLCAVVLSMLVIGCERIDENVTTTVTDINGNVYHTETIGTQVWMVENLKATKYNDGTKIPYVSDNSAWTNLSTPGYCWFNNDSAANNTRGALYNWYAVNTGKLCPKGWHVPTDAEWTTLINYLGGSAVAGGKLKETGTLHWTNPNTSASNESKFTLLPGGYRAYQSGGFFSFNDNSTLWSSTSNTSSTASSQSILYNSGEISTISNTKTYGISVRCIRD